MDIPAKIPAKLLIIEDDLDVADMLMAYFQVQGYEVQTANWGEDGIRLCQIAHPDLVILDIRLPDIDGFEVARRLRQNIHTARIPIIFLTEKRERADRLHGLELGADDYITKPFDLQELRLRVRNALRRARRGPLANPVTNLPEGPVVDERLQMTLESDQPWALLGVALRHLDVFRDRYGFIAADDVLRAIALMLQNAVRDMGNEDDFLGHLSATDFIIISTPDRLPNLETRIRERLTQSIDYFYPLQDREAGNFGPHKLSARITTLDPTQGPFSSLEALKAALVGTPKKGSTG